MAFGNVLPRCLIASTPCSLGAFMPCCLKVQIGVISTFGICCLDALLPRHLAAWTPCGLVAS